MVGRCAILAFLVLLSRPPAPPTGAAAPAGGEDGARRDPGTTPALDDGLEDEATILAEAESDPRNFFPDAFPVIRHPRYVEGCAAGDAMVPDEWVIGVVVAGQPLA